MTRTTPLQEFASVTLDASGTNTVYFSPQRYGQDWKIERITVTCNSAEETVFSLYRDFVQNSARIGGTYSGNNDTDSAAGITLRYGNRLVGQWTLGTAGAIANIVLDGEMVGR